jgi:ubiquitin-like protein Pup
VPEQTHVTKPAPQRTTEQDAKDIAALDAEIQAAQENEADLTHTDDLLDEIDSVLEVNAEEFMANFRQRGGE